jgi:serine/threonine protein kinase
MSNKIIVPQYSIASSDASSLPDFSSVRPSRQPQDTRSITSTSQNNQTINIVAFINILKRSGLPGPVVLLGDREFLGGGSQFAVYKQTHAWTDPNDGFRTSVVATKQLKVPLDSNARLDHADPRVTRHLEHLLLEIISARDSAFLGHPNIALPIAWSFDIQGFHSPFELVMELADCDLAAYLVDERRDVLLSEKFWMCRDIAAGLDALHECKLIHGDLKSGNILLYRRENRIVAKLADFGLSFDTMQTDARLGGTLGWQAPEVELGNVLTPEDIPLCDNYSFGLLVWSILLYAGKCPPRSERENRKAMACKQIEDSRDAIGLHASSPLPSIIFNLLDETGKRPRELEDLFESMTEGYKKL